MKRMLPVFCIIFLYFLYSDSIPALEKDTIRRFAIIIGANDGGSGRVKLQYSVTDAKSVLKVLNEMGGVMQDDSVLLIEPSRKIFFSGMDAIHKKIKQSEKTSGKREFIFYYSGHSDEESILLGKEKISYKEIRDFINNVPSDVRIAILDSCSSGAFTRLKGGKMRSPFLVDSAFNMKGYAFMTSSSPDEASQESERIKGSFFTHYLVAGLRGAADMTQDGRITLNEAYQFAYNETLAGTEKTVSGPQHPNYNIQMAGTGDVVMTDIRKSSSVMIIDAEISGKLFIRDKGNSLVCELRKSPGRTMQLGLDDGLYTITYIKEGNLYEASITLSASKEAVLSQNDFKKSSKDKTVARGGGDVEDSENKDETVEWEFSLYPMIHKNRNVINIFSFNLFGSFSSKLYGISLGLGPGIVREDVNGFQVNVAGNYTGGNLDGAQVSTIGNFAGGDITGAQLSNVFNIAKGNVKGAQVSNIFNISKGDFTGAQVSSVFNLSSKNVKGTQASCVFNHAGEKVTGLQLSAVYNYSGKDVTGSQISGVFNYTSENFKGAQIAAVANISGNAKGVQIGTVNLAGDFSGVQLGVINIAKTQNGWPIGLVNISQNGDIEIAVWGSTLITENAGLLFRSNYIYTIFSAGWNNLKEKIDNSFAYGFHLGVHIPIGNFYTAIDAGIIQIDNDKIFSDKNNTDQLALQGRVSIGYYVIKHLSVFAGVGLNYIYDCEFRNEDGETRFKEGKFSPLLFAGVKASLFGKS
jgi:hypothetical protein